MGSRAAALVLGTAAVVVEAACCASMVHRAFTFLHERRLARSRALLGSGQPLAYHCRRFCSIFVVFVSLLGVA